MDQEKSGRFIAEKRKAKNLTQQELADLLGISNKTVSRWECGYGMPEVGLMLPLCDALDISVNELLSGENLDNAYKEKAEENLIGLIKENEHSRLSSRKLFLWQAFSLILSIVLWSIFFTDSNIYHWGDAPTLLTLCYLAIGFICIYLTIVICIYGILKRNAAMIYASLSCASLGCMLICVGKNTLWLIIPAMLGMALCLGLSLWSICKTKKAGH